MNDTKDTINKDEKGALRPERRKGGHGGGGSRRPRKEREAREFDQKILDLARVTRVTAGGKRMRFRACVVIGDRKGNVGLGLAKGSDVAAAVEKSFRQAKKNIIKVSIVKESIPHRVIAKYGAAEVMIKPAPAGSGLKAGGAARVVLELAGVPNASSKILGSQNKINVARACLKALSMFSTKALTKI